MKFSDFGPQPQTVLQKTVSSKTEAENILSGWFSKLEGEVIGELMYIDETTLDYLQLIPSSCGIKIFVTYIEDRDKFIRSGKAEARKRPYLKVDRIYCLNTSGKELSPMHGRWIAGDNYEINLDVDLKSNALGKKHTITVTKEPSLSDRCLKFKDGWEADLVRLEKIYNKPDIKRETIL